VGAYAVAPSFNWIVLSLQPRAEALAVSPHFQTQAALFIFLVAALALSGSLWMSSRMVKPLAALIAGAQRSSRSEFNQPVPETGWGELVVLSQAFNAMMRTMQTYQEMQVDKLLEEKAKVESLVHTIPDGIVMASFDGRILYMNVAARSILAADSQAITGPRERTVHETLREPALREITLALMQRRKVSESREIELKKPDHSRLGVFLCRAVTVMHNQREIGFVLNLRDVTAERDLERLRDDFYHGVVHDLRGPLSNIDGFVHIMKTRWGKISEEQGKTYLGWVLRSCERLRQLVTDILDTAKIESGTLKLNLEMIPASDFLERTQALYALQTEHIGIEIKFELLEKPARLLQCDRNLIERVLMNLIGNALKFTPKGGSVTMRVGAFGPNEVEFSVTDTGPGMAQNKLQIIFEKFQQLEGEKRSAGYGLGLSICKKVVELHNGRIWAESQVGKGSRFIFRLPLPAGNPAAPAAAPAPK
jgi:PAS domain S-box-containing protein